LDVRLAEESPKIKLPFVLGREFSGQVLSTGSTITDYKIGDGVVCVTDGFKQGGGLAQEAVVNVDQCWKIPHGLKFQEAAVLPISYGTAVLTFSQFCELKENDLVLITAGPAGLGLAALDVCTNLYKAKVSKWFITLKDTMC
jgi:NADPH:quinone reductase-like Zn-dependent oxidoreductase